MSSRPLVAAAVLGCIAALALPSLCNADESFEKGVAVFEKHRDAVVTIRATVKIVWSGFGESDTEEEQMEVTGTVVDGAGLVVTSLMQLDPSAMYQMFAEEEDGFSVDSQIVGMEILGSDGVGIPAEVVLRDKDLDLAFVRTSEQPDQPMKAIDLKDSGAAKILEEIVVLDRLPKVLGRAPYAEVQRIGAIMERPRKYYVPSQVSGDTPMLGAPAFNLEGKVLGIELTRSIKPTGDMDWDENTMLVIVPAEDIIEAMAQVPKKEA